MPGIELITRTLRTSDGASLAWYDSGGTGRPVVLAGGLGGPIGAWRYQIDYLADRYRFVSWDYRGLFGSGRPPGDDPDLSVHRHADDLEAVMSAAGVSAPVALVGWSMGVQVVLEYLQRPGARASHLVLLNGTFGRPLDSVGLPLLSGRTPQLIRAARRVHQPGSALLRRASRWPETVNWLRRFGLIGGTLDTEFFRDLAAEFGQLDLDAYLKTLLQLGDHDASHYLADVRAPTLVITGDRDRMTPHSLAAAMAEKIPESELLLVRGATHYAPVEFPELVNLRIEKFFREHGYV